MLDVPLLRVERLRTVFPLAGGREAAAVDARERFSRDEIVAQYEALYADAVASANAPATKTCA